MSLTTDSKAIAATMPSWRSLASIWRVPNRMANAAIASVTIEVGALQDAVAAACLASTTSGYCSRIEKLVEIAFSCSEM